ncbi:hypothetical protein [Lonsdalea quercina]
MTNTIKRPSATPRQAMNKEEITPSVPKANIASERGKPSPAVRLR